MLSTSLLQKRLQISGILAMIGLLIEGVCLLWARPISFVIFVAVGGLLIFCGVIFFLFSLVSTPRARE